MNSLDKENAGISCPNPKCKKDMNVKYMDIIYHGHAKCPKCGSEIVFNSSAVSNLKYAMHNFDQAKDKLTSTIKQLMTKAEIKIKT